MEREQAIRLMQDLLRRMVEKKGSDLFITAGFPPAIKVDGEIRPQSDRSLSPEQSAGLVRAIMNDRQTKSSCDPGMQFYVAPPGIGRASAPSCNGDYRRGAPNHQCQDSDPRGTELPPISRRSCCQARPDPGQRHRLRHPITARPWSAIATKRRGYIVTIEDPVEYVHAHKGCVVTHREVGVDCELAPGVASPWRAPDVIPSAIRDRETWNTASAAETGHGAGHPHASFSNQAPTASSISFPGAREQLLMDLSLNIRAHSST
jgi:twitching motility protein PilU